MEPQILDPVPARNWRSLAAVLVVTGQNAFNDNVVKFTLMGLALAIAAGTPVGDQIEIILAAILLVPFVVLAPVAGYFSDRYSKRSVLLGSMVSQALIFGFTAVAVLNEQIRLAIFGFFLLSVQSTFFSPGKFGILKELVGSRKLGMVAGWMQMLTMMAILAGIWVGGTWFDALLGRGRTAWGAALVPILAVGGLSIVGLFVTLLVQRTPAHPGVRFAPRLMWAHFRHLGVVFRSRRLRFAALGIAYFWFLSNTLALVMVGVGRQLFPDLAAGGAAGETSKMTAMIGVGLMFGSLLVSILSRRRIVLGLVPLGGLMFVLGLGVAGFAPPGTWGFYGSLILLGVAGGFFLVPLNAYLQDEAEEEERGRVISASNLLNCLGGLVSLGLVYALKAVGVLPAKQLLLMLPATALVTLAVTLRDPRRRAGRDEG